MGGGFLPPYSKNIKIACRCQYKNMEGGRCMIGIMLDVVSIVLNLIIIILLTKWLKKNH